MSQDCEVNEKAMRKELVVRHRCEVRTVSGIQDVNRLHETIRASKHCLVNKDEAGQRLQRIHCRLKQAMGNKDNKQKQRGEGARGVNNSVEGMWQTVAVGGRNSNMPYSDRFTAKARGVR